MSIPKAHREKLHLADAAEPQQQAKAAWRAAEERARQAQPDTHLVVRGDTLSQLAARYHTSVSAFMRANRGSITNPNLIYAGTAIRVPAPSSGGGSRAMQKGESLPNIAKRLGTTVDSLLATSANPGSKGPTFSAHPASRQSPSDYFGSGVKVSQLPAGMRNNNPGNLKYSGSAFQRRHFPGMVGPSRNLDQGSPQIVFSSPLDGMTAAARLAHMKYRSGLRTVRDLISHPTRGWTPGAAGAASNIARQMGVKVNERVNLDDTAQLHRFLRALITQEHGPASRRYGDDLITSAIERAF